jgi:CheY-like chemotaxis protein
MEQLALQTPVHRRKVVSHMTQAVPLVMIVEDNVDSMYLMERFTRTSGCRALGTTSGEKVLNLARQERPAVIFLDLMLPGMSGWEVLQALRADPLTCPIPIILCTALNEADRAHEAGVGYLHKPIYYQDFLTALADVGIEPPSP